MNSYVKGLFGLKILVFLSISGFSKHKPNIIWLMAEDISTDIECYGMQSVKTPVLNQLAEEGVIFTNAYVTNPICSPSRSAMLVGAYQTKISAQHHRSNREIPLSSPFLPITKILRDSGYTCILGSKFVMDQGRKIDVNFKTSNIGCWDGVKHFGLFDKYDDISPADQPFFAQIQLKVTHRGDWWNDIRKNSNHKVNPDSVVLPPYMADHPVIRLDWAKYLDQIEHMDKEIGSIIHDLKIKGLYDNTVIVFMSDNGRCNIRGKGYLYQSGIHIPLIIKFPKGGEKGKFRHDLVSSIDLTATILDLAGVSIPEFMDGISILRENFHRDYILSSRDLWDEILDKSKSIVTKRYKYIHHYMPDVPFDAGQAYLEFYRPAIHVMRKLKWEKKLKDQELDFFKNKKPNEELYDLSTDPDEIINLADNVMYNEVLKELRNQMKKAIDEMAYSEAEFAKENPISIEVINWLKYRYRKNYNELLDGTEIGYQKYLKLYENEFNNDF